ncbi:transporter substrate-binding domain-containing protein [Burkholderia multivorans]|uniref:transporter substrate-binding domain-containing protein n=1 Tax=Burkholderia multivorans TaxID=87883 RepID=UPI0021C210D2|nr:transporter substrate-binding domain-containing protein [Burkholderia multivorans]
MKLTVAYIEEPPFGWTEAGGKVSGADINLADAVLRAIGVTQIEYRRTTFGELLPGVAAGLWDMNVPLFVTPERADLVAFSVPVWAIGDGFLVRTGNPKALDSYGALAKRQDARLGVITGQVQHDSAKASGIAEHQISTFADQARAIEAVRSGEIDAYASTALGNRILVDRIGGSLLEAVEHRLDVNGAHQLPFGAFSFSHKNTGLRDAINVQLRLYLGSSTHLTRMAEFGLTPNEINPALGQ